MLPIVKIELAFQDGFVTRCEGIITPIGFVLDMAKPEDDHLTDRIKGALEIIKDKLSPLPLFLGDTVNYTCSDFTFSMQGVVRDEAANEDKQEEVITRSTEEILARFSTKGQTPQ